MNAYVGDAGEFKSDLTRVESDLQAATSNALTQDFLRQELGADNFCSEEIFVLED